jgi:hypothetical protein
MHTNVVHVIGCRFSESESRCGFLFTKVAVEVDAVDGRFSGCNGGSIM